MHQNLDDASDILFNVNHAAILWIWLASYFFITFMLCINVNRKRSLINVLSRQPIQKGSNNDNDVKPQIPFAHVF